MDLVMLIDRPLDLAYKRATMDMSVTKVGCLSDERMYYRVRERELRQVQNSVRSSSALRLYLSYLSPWGTKITRNGPGFGGP